MARRISEAQLLVLALDLDQQRAGPSHQRHPDRLVVDKRPRPAVAAQHAAQHQLILGLDALVGQ